MYSKAIDKPKRGDDGAKKKGFKLSLEMTVNMRTEEMEDVKIRDISGVNGSVSKFFGKSLFR